MMTIVKKLIGVGLLLICLSALAQAPSPRLVRIGAFQYYPGIFQDKDGHIKGIYVDLFQEIASREGWKIEYSYGSWAEGLLKVKSGQVDMLTSVAFTEERAQYMDYAAEPILTVWGQLYVHGSSRIDGILELQEKRVAVMKEDFNGNVFKELVKSFNLTCEIVECVDFDEVFRTVELRKADAGVVNSTYGAAKRYEFDVKETGVVFNPFRIYFTVGKGRNAEVLETLDRYLAAWRANPDSIYHKSRRKWMHGSVNSIPVVPKALRSGLIALALFSLVATGFGFLLRFKVKRAVWEWKTREVRLRAIFEAASDIGFIIAETNQERRILEFSPGAEKILGYAREQAVGKSYSAIFPAIPARESSHSGAAHRKAGGFSGEVELTRENGERFPARLTTYTLADDHRQPHATLAVCFDLSEQKAMESRLTQAQKMESVGRLAGGVAHDFNNIVQTILGYSDLALTKVKPGAPLYDELCEIQEAAFRSAGLTQQLLAFARKQPVAPHALDLNETVGNFQRMGQRLIGEDIRLLWKPGSGLWNVFMDSTQLDQILVNLLANARDAIPDTGIVTIQTSNVTIDQGFCSTHPESTVGEYVVLGVTDTGHGMDTETLKNVFEPFFTTKARGKGTGLGLATVYGVVKQNGGFIVVESELRVGSTFKIHLPRCREEVEPRLSPTENAVPTGREAILIVEDEPRILELARRALGQLGYNVITASSPEAALTAAQRNAEPIHMLLTDVVMPGMNGRELLDRMRRFRPEIKCLFMSGYTADIIATRGVLDEGINFIEKPFTTRALAEKVRGTLDQPAAI
jgi:PAS domain S-box-containing protein